MIDPLSPLFQAHDEVAAALMPNAADPQSALAVMIIGIIIIVATGFWAIGGLSAAVWVGLKEKRERRFPHFRRGTEPPGT